MFSGLDEKGGPLSLINDVDIIYNEVVCSRPFTNQSMCIHGPDLPMQNIQKPSHPGPFFFIIVLFPWLSWGLISDPNVK